MSEGCLAYFIPYLVWLIGGNVLLLTAGYVFGRMHQHKIMRQRKG